MRKDQVEPSTVNIKIFTQCSGTHRRAFDVPAGPPRTPRALPGWLSGLHGLPQGKVCRCAFARCVVCRTELFHFLSGELSILAECSYAEPHRAVLNVCKFLVNQGLHQVLDILNLFRDPRLLIRWNESQTLRIPVKGINVPFRECHGVFPFSFARRMILVIHICEVPNEAHTPSPVSQITNERIEDDHRPGMSYVAVIVNCHSTYVERYLSWLDWLKGFDAPAQSVV